MKKTLLTLTLVTLGACAAFAQGTVNFDNRATTLGDSIDRLVRNLDGSPLTGTEYVAALYFGSSADSINQLAVATANPTLEGSIGRFRASTTSVPGTWSGGSRTLNGGLPGTTVFMQIRVWNQSQFATYQAALGRGPTGESDPFEYAISSSPTPSASDLRMVNLRGFQLEIVPEPSTIALAVLGLGSLLLFRRRK